MVEKRKDPNDLRINRVALTASGRSLIADISREAQNNLMDKALSEMSDSALNSLLEYLHQLCAHLKEPEENKK